MASNPPGACCVTRSFHEGTPVGQLKELFGLETYVSGTNEDRVLVLLTDIYGHKFNNVQLIADELAKNNYKVLIPDILMNDPVKEGTDFGEWRKVHAPEITSPIVDKWVVAAKKELNPKFFGVIGYCYGCKFAVDHLTKDGVFDAGAFAHPSFVTEEQLRAVAKPLTISAAETDSIFTKELRHISEDILTENKVHYELTLFSGVSHGFAVKGDVSIPAVKYAKEKSLFDHVFFFSQF